MKNRIVLFLLLASLAVCRAATSYITDTLTFTNTTTAPSGFIVAGQTVRYTNSPLDAVNWIQTGTSNVSATNFWNWALAQHPELGPVMLSSNVVQIAGNGLTLSIISDNFVNLSQVIGTGTSAAPIMLPTDTTSVSNRIWVWSNVVWAVNTYASNAFASDAFAMSNFVNLTRAQTLYLKTIITPTITGGTNTGGVNSNMLYGNVTGAFTIQTVIGFGGSISNAFLTNSPGISGTGSVIYAGRFIGPDITNAPSVTTTTLHAGGGWASGLVGTNWTIYTLALPGAGSLSTLLSGDGSSTANGSLAVVVGNSSSADGFESVATGYGNQFSSDQNFGLGSENTIDGSSAFAIVIGTLTGINGAPNAQAYGTGNNVTHASARVFGDGLSSTRAHQFLFGTASEFVDIPGTLTVSGPIISPNTTNGIFRGTNNWIGDIAFTPLNNTSLANGNNSGVILGTNVDSKLSGPSAAYTIAGFVAQRDGQWHKVLAVNPVSSLTILNDSGLEATAANRITTRTGGSLVITNNPAVFSVSYDTATTHWIMESIDR